MTSNPHKILSFFSTHGSICHWKQIFNMAILGCEHRSSTHQSANQNIVTLNMKGAKTASLRQKINWGSRAKPSIPHMRISLKSCKASERKMINLPVSQSHNRQLLSADPVSTFLVSPERRQVKDPNMRILSTDTITGLQTHPRKFALFISMSHI